MNLTELIAIYQKGRAKYHEDRFLFGAVVGLILLVVSVFKIHRGRWDLRLATALFLAGLALIIFRPLCQPFYAAIYTLGQILSRINTAVILFLVYFLLLTPIGLIKRLVNPDRRFKSFDAAATSYFTKVSRTGKSEYRKQY